MTGPDEPPIDETPDPVSQLRSLPDRYREVLTGQRGEAPEEDARRDPNAGAGADLPPQAFEEAAHARDLLDSAARRVERLLEDSKPVGDLPEAAPPRRGPSHVDPEVVLEVLDTNAERLAQLVEGVPEEVADRGPKVRAGLEAISGEMVSEVVTESERRLRRAQRTPDEDD